MIGSKWFEINIYMKRDDNDSKIVKKTHNKSTNKFTKGKRLHIELDFFLIINSKKIISFFFRNGI